MNKVSMLYGKSKVFDLDGAEIEIRPLTAGDMEILNRLNSESTQVDATKELISKVLKYNFPGIPDEEVNNVSLSNIFKIMEWIMEVNGFKDADKEKFLKNIKEKQGIQ